MTKNGHSERYSRELMCGENQHTIYACPLTSEPEAQRHKCPVGVPVNATLVHRGCQTSKSGGFIYPQFEWYREW